MRYQTGILNLYTWNLNLKKARVIAIQRNEAESGRKMQGVDAIGVFGEGIYAALELLLFALPEGFQSGII